MEQNFQSGEEYANALIDGIIDMEIKRTFGPPIDERLMVIWAKYIRQFANQTYHEYILGNRDSYMINDIEFKELFNKASLQYTEEIIGDLVDKGALKMSVGDDGEILYSVTEEGKKLYNDSTGKS